MTIVSLSPDGRTLSLASPTALGLGRSHSLSVYGVRDLAGNAGFMTLFFTTALVADTVAPQVVLTNPEDGTGSAAINSPIQVLFDEPIEATSASGVSVLLGGVPLTVTRMLTNVNRMLTLTPNGLLAPNAAFTISVAGVRDTSGNVLATTSDVPTVLAPISSAYGFRRARRTGDASGVTVRRMWCS